ncbi:hypothetical protein EJB05_49744, partial [Eragrostis curvula]
MITPPKSLDPRSTTSSKGHPDARAGSGFVPVILGKPPTSKLPDKSSSTRVLHNLLSFSGIIPVKLFPASASRFNPWKSAKNTGIGPDRSLFPDKSSVSKRRQLARLGGNPMPLNLLYDQSSTVTFAQPPNSYLKMSPEKLFPAMLKCVKLTGAVATSFGGRVPDNKLHDKSRTATTLHGASSGRSPVNWLAEKLRY